VERVLLRALANTEHEGSYARHLAQKAISDQPAWFEHLAAFAALQALIERAETHPLDAIESPAQRAFLAEALMGETRPPEETEVASALQELEERSIESRQRNLRALIAEAERRADFAQLAILTQQKLELDRALRQLHNRKPGNA